MPQQFTQILTLLLLLPMLCGCRFYRGAPLQQMTAPSATTPSPIAVPLLDRMLVMDEISDEVDNFLPILREERPRLVDGILSEGYIETRPTIGGQIFEPWKKDSTPGFERLHATLQTIRRFAKVRVIPTQGSYVVDVKVYKELEDLPQPVNSTVSGRPLRFDNTLDKEFYELFDVTNRGWIPQGRDYSLEQTILEGISARFAEIARQNVGGRIGPNGPIGPGSNGRFGLPIGPQSLQGPNCGPRCNPR